jgi:hypothetical protein
MSKIWGALAEHHPPPPASKGQFPWPPPPLGHTIPVALAAQETGQFGPERLIVGGGGDR